MGNNKDMLGTRMKTYYEQIPKTKLMRRTPVIIRLDGKSFHTFTKGFRRPFDNILCCSMENTMLYLCKNIQGCVLGYTQSDEITLVLVDYNNLNTQAWFDYEVQKMCSVSASMATMAFNKSFSSKVEYHKEMCFNMLDYKYIESLERAVKCGAVFDSRVFNVPKEEVTNCIYWRQLDAMRNSIQMTGQAYFSPKELHGKSCESIKEMLYDRCNIVWDAFPGYMKWGSCAVKHAFANDKSRTTEWSIDLHIPLFVNEGRNYIEKLINV